MEYLPLYLEEYIFLRKNNFKNFSVELTAKCLHEFKRIMTNHLREDDKCFMKISQNKCYLYMLE